VNTTGSSCLRQALRKKKLSLSPASTLTGGNQTEFFPLEPFSEDCLTLNVWTPQTQSHQEKLPVFVWFFGGGFLQGGINALYYNPQSWVQRTQEHIFVTVNSRSNIFGFPNAAGLIEQNLGLLDRRMALEWVRHNIALFGGGAAAIVGWGESAGAIAWNYLDSALPGDSIVSGMILSSGTALFPARVRSFHTLHDNFSAVAKALGCGAIASQLDCIRNVSWQSVETVVEADPSLSFLTIVDKRIIFSNYT
jgi:acetylcholinesterase